MKTFICFLIYSMFLYSMAVKAQNAPVTIGGVVLDPGPTVVVPIKVTNFVDIGAISLTMDYNYSIVHFSGITSNINLPGFLANEPTPGHIIMGWYTSSSSGVNLSDYDVMVNITFTGLLAGETDLTWIDNGASCEYAKYDGGAFTVLNDLPTGDYYKNGHITWQRPGPKTIAPFYCSPPNQVVCLPVKVNQFSNVGAISLTLDYNPSVLLFQYITPSLILGTWTFSGQAVNAGRLIVGGYGPGIASLPDGYVLFYACFYYYGGTSALTWYDDNGISCEYADATTLNPLADRPMATYYINGSIGPPILHADFYTDNTTPTLTDIVTFYDASTGSPTAWNWTFDKAVVYMNGTTLHSQNPQVQFTENCLYTVTLVINNSYEYCSDTEIKVGYIRVGIPGLWTGISSTDWYTPGNWDDCLVPTASTDVLIPATAPNWPYYIGNFTIGTQCKTITLSAITSQMTITLDLIIP